MCEKEKLFFAWSFLIRFTLISLVHVIAWFSRSVQVCRKICMGLASSIFGLHLSHPRRIERRCSRILQWLLAWISRSQESNVWRTSRDFAHKQQLRRRLSIPAYRQKCRATVHRARLHCRKQWIQEICEKDWNENNWSRSRRGEIANCP